MNDINHYQPSQHLAVTLSYRVKGLLWQMVNATLYRFSPNFFRGWRRWLLRLFGAEIADTASPNRRAKITNPWNLSVGKDSSLGQDCWIYALDRITIGDKCCIGVEVKILTGSHNINSSRFDLITKPVVIDSGVWLATGCCVLPGVDIGEGAVVAAYAVVARAVEPWTVVGGNPAKLIKKREIKP